MQVAVIGDRNGRHAQFFGRVHKVTNLRGAVKNRVLGVHVKVNE
jgi:hypothetical protein